MHTIQDAMDLALQHHQAGRLREAEQIYRQVLAQNPNHAQAIHLLGVIAQQAGRHDVAVPLFRRSLSLDRGVPQVHSNLGNSLKSLGEHDDAIAAYRQAIALDPKYADAHNNLGVALKAKHQLAEAARAFRQAIVLRPDFPEAHNNLGNVLRDQGQLDDAIAAYQAAIHINSHYADAHYNLGNALRETGQNDQAIAAYHDAIRAYPDHAMAHCNLGIALMDSGKLADAIASYHRAIDINPKQPEAYSNLGIVLKTEGRFDEAIFNFQKAIALNPNFAIAHSNLGMLLHQQDRAGPWIDHLRTAVDLNFSDSGMDRTTPWAGADTTEFERVASHQSKQCSLTIIAGESFAASQGVAVYLNSLARVFSGDRYVLACDLSAERENVIQQLGFTIARIPSMGRLLTDMAWRYSLYRDRWWLYDAFMTATHYDRYLITDSRDVLFQGNPFDYRTDEDCLVLSGEGMSHRDSAWNYADQLAVQKSVGGMRDFQDWQIVNGGVQYGTRGKIQELASEMCKHMSGRAIFTDQGALNFIYHTSLKHRPGFELALPDEQAFCITCAPMDEAAPGPELQWNGNELLSPRAGIYRLVHQWDKTPFAKQILEANGL